jgi:hypothetical protein
VWPAGLASIIVVVQVDDEAEAMAAHLLSATVIGRTPRLGELVRRGEGLELGLAQPRELTRVILRLFLKGIR